MQSMGHVETVYKWIHTSIIKTSSAHSIDLIDLFYLSFETLIGPLDTHCSKHLERVVSFNFAAMTFTPLLKKWPQGWGI